MKARAIALLISLSAIASISYASEYCTEKKEQIGTLYIQYRYDDKSLSCNSHDKDITASSKIEYGLKYTIGNVVNSDQWHGCFTDNNGVSTDILCENFANLLTENNIYPACPYAYVTICKGRESFAQLLHKILDLSLLQRDHDLFICTVINEYCAQDNVSNDKNEITIVL